MSQLPEDKSVSPPKGVYQCGSCEQWHVAEDAVRVLSVNLELYVLYCNNPVQPMHPWAAMQKVLRLHNYN